MVMQVELEAAGFLEWEGHGQAEVIREDAAVTKGGAEQGDGLTCGRTPRP